MRPVVMITGFLGVGKTTLLRDLLKAFNEEGLSSDVILNDYADADVDCATLEELAESIEPLTAACACCDGLEFLLDLSMQSAQSTSDMLFVELNGTADPVPVVETFAVMEKKLKLHPRWQVCVIDVRHFGERGSYSDIEKMQLQTASHLYFSHLDGEEVRKEILEEVRSVNSFATVVSKEELMEAVIGLAGRKRQRLLDTGADEVVNPLDFVKKSAEHKKTHEFTSCKILLPAEAAEERVREWLRDLPSEVIRAKVLIAIEGKPEYRYLFERVGGEVVDFAQRVSLGRKVSNSAIFIGPDLDPLALEDSVKNYL